jgi:hypothetical protein
MLQSSGNELTGLWTRPQGGPLATGFLQIAPNPWSLKTEYVTQISFADRMANYILQLPVPAGGVAFQNMKGVLVVEIQDQNQNSARSGYDLVCAATVN